MIGYALCASFCTVGASLGAMEKLVSEGHELLPIVSERLYETDSRFAPAQDVRREILRITGREPIHTVADAEPLGPKTPLDALVVAPITGNTLAKAALGITDSAVCMAIKAHLRADRPLLLALASNDALSANLKNVGALLSRKSVYFLPMREDDPTKKPYSLVADFSRISEGLGAAMEGRQLHPLFVNCSDL